MTHKTTKKPRRAKAKETMACHNCGSAMRRDTRSATIDYKGHALTVQQPGWYCVSCDESVLTSEDMAATESDFLDLRAEVDDVLKPDEVRQIRRRLKLSQRKAGDLLGGGPRAFQKYESGATAVSRPMTNLLRLLANDPKRLAELSRGE